MLYKIGGDSCEGADLCGDASYYAMQADRIAAGHWFTLIGGVEAADHPPLTALVLTPASLVFENGILAKRFTMAALGVAAVVVLAQLAKELVDARSGAIVGVLAALNPNLWLNDGVAMAEAPTALALALGLLSLHRWHHHPSFRHASIVALFFGVATLARPESALLAMVAMIPLVMFHRGQSRTQKVATLGVVAGAAVVVLAPWVFYNATRFSDPVLLSTNDGLTLAGANCDDMYSGGGVGYWSLACGVRQEVEGSVPPLWNGIPTPTGDQSQEASRQRDVGFTYISNHTRELPSVMLIRIGRVWGIYGPDQMAWLGQGEGRERALSWMAAGTWLALVAIAVAGARTLQRSGRLWWPLLAPLFTVTVVAALFYGNLRFRLPADITITVLAGLVLSDLFGRYASRVDDLVPENASTAS